MDHKLFEDSEEGKKARNEFIRKMMSTPLGLRNGAEAIEYVRQELKKEQTK